MKRPLPFIVAFAAAMPAQAVACGWWGENLDEKSSDAVIVESMTDKPDLSTPEGMARMARACRIGDGVPQDDLVARRWAGPAARGGHVGAMNDYAQMLEQGIGGPQDLAAAAEWYERAAEAGNAQAMHSLAHMHFDGRGVARDWAKAADLMRRSAAAGHASAAEELALMLWRGDLGEREPNEACLWWLTADLKTPSDGADTCRAHDPGLTDGQIAELRQRAVDLVDGASHRGPGS
ncbi:tetratricopeptide repeat protein [Jhaorihella thermophila]|uniref:Sel1 repeat-containing protein n=1 Tax=Jhaorihella thermophila TaxID=488547 RepID=A0A1H5ZDA4_9RHOB|nr:tetratricopeptide repeat protein [Jhaorihella thermophila]SEG34251.1 Sel1 repeat-containing protein [Jhaorihella thermophila]